KVFRGPETGPVTGCAGSVPSVSQTVAAASWMSGSREGRPRKSHQNQLAANFPGNGVFCVLRVYDLSVVSGTRLHRTSVPVTRVRPRRNRDAHVPDQVQLYPGNLAEHDEKPGG